MSQLEDFELSAAAESAGAGGDPPPRRPKWPLAAAVAAAVALAGGTYWWLSRPARPAPGPEAPAPAPAPSVPESAVAPPAEPEPIELPELTASDELVRRLVAGLSSHPELASWLVTDDLLTRFVAAVDNVAEGRVPRPHVGFLEPEGDFAVRRDGSRVWLDPVSYRRYDAFAAAVASIDAEGAVRLYRQLEPLIDEAYRELGYPQRDFDATLRAALRQIGSAPRPSGDIELVEKVASFEFADPELESLPPIHKQLLRLGPANLARVKASAAALERALGR